MSLEECVPEGRLQVKQEKVILCLENLQSVLTGLRQLCLANGQAFGPFFKENYMLSGSIQFLNWNALNQPVLMNNISALLPCISHSVCYFSAAIPVCECHCPGHVAWVVLSRVCCLCSSWFECYLKVTNEKYLKQEVLQCCSHCLCLPCSLCCRSNTAHWKFLMQGLCLSASRGSFTTALNII